MAVGGTPVTPIDKAGNVIGGSSSPVASTVTGNVASGAADSGNPVKTGGKYNLALPTFADGNRGDFQIDVAGRQLVVASGTVATGVAPSGNPVYMAGLVVATPTNVTDGTVQPLALDGRRYLWVNPGVGGVSALSSAAASDSLSNSSTRMIVQNQNMVFDGTDWDRVRGNIDTSALITASGATTSQTGADQTNYNGRGLQVVLDMTVVGTGSVTLTIQGKDAASGKYYTLLAGAAVVTNSTNVYTVYPGAPTTANVSAPFPLPRTWRVITTANNANATTYTVGASVIV